MIGRRRFIGNLFAAMATTTAMPSFARTIGGPSKLTGLRQVHNEALNASHPEGAVLRIIAKTGEPALPGGAYIWHGAPDGGACFTAPNGGWVYVSNSELPRQRGGAGALRFAADGTLKDAYSILNNTTDNCAGGRTPWNTWLSCEENNDEGQVYECDPFGLKPAVVRPGMGSFNHEAAAVDPMTGHVYLTEDKSDGCLYRFTPDTAGDLAKGRLDVAIAQGTRLAWVPLPDPSAASAPTRKQVAEAARFKGGEGIVYADGRVFFTTKGDDKVWELELASQELKVIYDVATSGNPILKGVDNIEVSPTGELLIAEDNGDMQIVALTENYQPVPLVTLFGQDSSEITGPAFSPDGRRLYFSSQRGSGGSPMDGLTYELDLRNTPLFV